MPNTVFASGINCKNPTVDFDRTICKDKDLFASDKEMNHLYNSVIKKLSASSRDPFVQNQRIWLKFARMRCTGIQLEALVMGQEECIKNEYDVRKKHLGEALTASVDGTLILTNEVSRSFPPADQTSEAYKPDKSVAPSQYPVEKITSLSFYSTVENGVNASLPPVFKFEGSGCELDSTETVTFRGSKLIVVQSGSDRYCKGMAHPTGGINIITLKMPSLEKVSPSDIFDFSKNWQDALTNFVVKALPTDIGFGCPGPDCTITSDRLKQGVVSGDDWEILPSGLTVQYSQYELAHILMVCQRQLLHGVN
ncbi:MAG: hypothetical protein JWO78_1378 [Micavibrio sp.]|nr:hypothetical protein [Micavibrio sp.]